MSFDRAAILREAHTAARRRCAPSHYYRTGDRYDPELTAWVPKAGYRAIFGRCLRDTWRTHKHIAAEQAYEASLPPVDEAILAQVDALRAAAWGLPITRRGNDAMVAQLATAAAMIEVARFGAAP